jgi:hypothetical protein
MNKIELILRVEYLLVVVVHLSSFQSLLHHSLLRRLANEKPPRHNRQRKTSVAWFSKIRLPGHRAKVLPLTLRITRLPGWPDNDDSSPNITYTVAIRSRHQLGIGV